MSGQGIRTVKMHSSQEILSVLPKDTGQAEAMARENISDNPKLAKSHLLLAYILSQQSNFQGALESLKETIHLNPDSVEGYFNLGYIYQQIGDLNAAIAHYQQSTSLSNGRFREAKILLGNTLHQKGDCKRVVLIYQDLLKDNPNDIRAIFCLAQVYKETREYQLADEQMEKLQKILQEAEDVVGYAALAHFFSRYDFYQWQRFDNKAKLTQVFREYDKNHTDKLFKYYPQTFILPEEYEQFSQEHKKHRKDAFWIEKATTASCGQGAKLVSNIRHLKSTEACIVQRYIDDPLLLEGRKFNIRLYFVISMVNPLRVFLWKEGIVFLGDESYECSKSTLSNRMMHIINPILFSSQEDEKENEQEKSKDSNRFLRLTEALEKLHNIGYDKIKIWDNITALARDFFQVVKADGLFQLQTAGELYYAYPPKLIGMDILINSALEANLLEVERFPGLTGLKPLTKLINESFGQDMVSLVSVMHNQAELDKMSSNDYMARQAQLEVQQAVNFELIVNES